jgi:hypothetical protein
MPLIDGYQPPPVWPQCTKILEDLLRLVLAEEMKALLSDPATGEEGRKASTTEPDIDRTPYNGSTSSNPDIEACAHLGPQDEPFDASEIPNLSTIESASSTFPQEIEQRQPHSQPQYAADSFLSPDGDFEDALLSLQSGKYRVTDRHSRLRQDRLRLLLIRFTVIFGDFTAVSSTPLDYTASMLGSSSGRPSYSAYNPPTSSVNPEQLPDKTVSTEGFEAASMEQEMDGFGGQMWMWRL